MGGFFSAKETESQSRPDGKTYSCVSCGLHKECESPKMKAFGNFKKKILNIGEAPGKEEDRVGKQWQGKTGKLLQQTYAKYGIDLFNDCLNINAVNCRPPDNRTPDNYEIGCCRKSILNLIAEKKPKVIVLLGNAAVYSLIGHRWKKDLGGINKWRGFTIPDQDFKAWICPIFHPSYVDRAESKEVTTIWEQDIKQITEQVDEPFLNYAKAEVEIVEDLSKLKSINQYADITFDYETTGLKPHAEGHRIICSSVADSENHAYVFMMPKSRVERQPFLDLLTNPNIGKIAHNMKFEDTWTTVRLRIQIQNWVHDTMIASHVLDNRPGITSLKFQAYINFGIVDYASEIAPYLQAIDPSNGNSLNRIQELLSKPRGRDDLLYYCGLDAIYEYRLAMKQRLNILPF